MKALDNAALKLVIGGIGGGDGDDGDPKKKTETSIQPKLKSGYIEADPLQPKDTVETP
jgi:hypothetical protein